MHGNILNVPRNLDLVQNVLTQMSYEEFSISMFKKCRIYIYAMWHSFKSCYESGKRNLLNSIIYIYVKVSIKPNWQGFIKLANTNQNDQLQRDEFEKNHHMESFK